MNPVYFRQRPIGFFDGATSNGLCGVGIVLKMRDSHFFKIHMAVGAGNNIRAELLALWGLLSFSISRQILELTVAGDSKVVLDWFTGKESLNVLSLQPWMFKTLDLKNNFRWLDCFHVHKQFNSEAC
jgi:ribonuclease HI